MLGQFKPVAYDPYRRRRARRVPRWLLLLAAGIAVGAAGVVLVQERYLPPRLSAQASSQLQADFAKADAERQRLAAELGATTQRLADAAAERKTAVDDAAASRETAQRLRAELGTLIAALPPDPRGGAVEIRAARFALDGDGLAYDVALSRPKGGAKPLAGVLQLVVAGASARNADDSVTLKPIPISIGAYDVVHGSVALPAGFKPRQTTVQVLDKPGGARLGMRVYANTL